RLGHALFPAVFSKAARNQVIAVEVAAGPPLQDASHRKRFGAVVACADESAEDAGVIRCLIEITPDLPYEIGVGRQKRNQVRIGGILADVVSNLGLNLQVQASLQWVDE